MPAVTRLHVTDIPAPGNELALPAAALAHVRARRLKPGAELALFDGSGGAYRAVLLELGRRQARVRIDGHEPREAESPLSLTLLQGVSKGERMDLAVRKATELGVDRIVPVLAEHSVIRLDAERGRRRQQHWQAVAVSACEQCGRNRVPEIATPQPIAEALALPEGLQGLVLDTGGGTGIRGVAPAPGYALLIGPEGGLSAAELDQAAAAGFRRLRLGPRVLRTETAAIVALTVLQVRFGDLG